MSYQLDERIEKSPNRRRNQALNELVKAREATEKISKGDLTELKSLKAPPANVKLIMSPCNILFGKQPDWNESKKLLQNANTFKDSMKKYDISQVTPEML